MEWISASSTRNCLLANPLIDWLRLHGEAKGFIQDSAVEGYDPRLEFSRFAMAKGLAFEQAILKHIETLADVLTIAQGPRDIRDPAMAERTRAAMAAERLRTARAVVLPELSCVIFHSPPKTGNPAPGRIQPRNSIRH